MSVDYRNVVGGDFNCVDSLELDTLNHSNTSCTLVGHKELNAVIADFGLEDRWRVQNPGCKKYTWSNKSGNQASRLDRFYIPSDLESKKCEISVFPFSDHKLVLVDLEISKTRASTRPRMTHWKLNTKILEEDDYRRVIKDLICDFATLMDAYEDVTVWWDDFKTRVKTVTISYCSKRKFRLNQKYDVLKCRLANCPPSEEYAELKGQIRAMYENKYRITNIKSEIEKDLLDEKCSGYFFRRTRERRKKNLVKGVKDREGNLVEGTDQVLEVFRQFYESLYEKHENGGPDGPEWLFTQPPQESQPSSSEESVGSGEVTFEAEQLRKVLRGMNVNKAPGPDGLPPEFYQTFYDDLVGYMLSTYNGICQLNRLPESWRDAITVLIQKDGDPTDPANQRPISLLNSDYKLFTKYLNESFVQKHLVDCIPSPQLCSVKGRSIHDGLILIRDLIEYERSKKGDTLIVALDQRKAFDMVDHDVLIKAMAHFGFSTDIVKLIKMLYHGNRTRIKVNGELSDFVNVNRGVRQGCPLSASLYIVYLQIFLNILTGTSKYGLEGIRIPGSKRIKVSAYADDLVLFCNSDYEIQQSFEFFEKVARITGSQLNREKTEILNISTRSVRADFKQFLRSEIKICGVIFSNSSYKEIAERNVFLKRERIEKKLDKLKSLRVSLIGKVLLVNSVVHSQLYFLSGVYLPPKKHLEEIRRLSFRFIWEEKREVIKRQTIETSKDCGGIGLNNLSARCKALYFDCNVQRPSSNGFDHQRIALFKYFFAFTVRDFYPNVFSNMDAHSLVLCDPYKSAEKVLVQIQDKLETVAPLQVSSNQLYRWMLPEEEDVPLVFDIDKDCKSRLFALWKDGIVAVKDKDLMWRTAMGGLKTGSFIRRYNIPGANIGCKFCPETVETPDHLMLTCPGLSGYRNKLVDSVVKLGCTLRAPPHLNEDRNLVLLLGLCPLPESKAITRDVFTMVARSFRALWAARNEAHFGNKQGDLQSLISSLGGLCQRILDKFQVPNV